MLIAFAGSLAVDCPIARYFAYTLTIEAAFGAANGDGAIVGLAVSVEMVAGVGVAVGCTGIAVEVGTGESST